MPNTYTELARQTLGTNVDDVTFSSISGSYTDLVLVIVAAEATANTNGLRIRVGNNTIDTGNNYSNTYLTGTGTSATSNRESNNSSIGAAWQTAPSGNVGENVTIFHLMNYSNTTTFKTVLGRSNQAAQAAEATVGLWRSTVAINTILVRTSAGSGNQLKAGSTFSLYGIANADQGAAKATGGIITEDSQYWYHTFGASGAFIPKQSLTCDVLVVAGGGGGGSYRAGGGGAGGLNYFASQSLTAISHTVTVGAGGSGAAQTNVTAVGAVGTSGVNSQFYTLTAAAGGGRGGAPNGGTIGASGGSGGGSSADPSYANTPAGAASPAGQGNAGGTGQWGTNYYGAGGGGGNTAAGGNGSSSTGGGAGGAGSSVYSSWGAVTGTGHNVNGTYWYAGGGAGGAYSGIAGSGAVAGGNGGGGSLASYSTGQQVSGGAGIANTGGGGAGSVSIDTAGNMGNGGNGGSGVVIVRYAK
jgi:hypothetical protein